MIYIGQTVKSLNARWKAHCNSRSCCKYLHHAIQKYGKENFAIEEIDGANSLTELNYLEKHYIWIFDSLVPNGYNLRSGGGNSLHSEISKSKMRKPKTESAKLNMSNAQMGKPPNPKAIENSVKARVGKKLTDEHKKKCSKALKGRKFSDEHKRKISEALKGKKVSELTKEKLSKIVKEWHRNKNG